jgi:hypothetical protein
MIQWLLLVAIVLLFWGSYERFVNPDFPITRPKKDAAWLSKIDAHAPIGGDDDLYLSVLQTFFDKVYEPSPTNPTDKDVEAFLKTPEANRPGIDINAMRKMIANSFDVELTMTAAQREEQELKFKPSEALYPKEGRDQVYARTEAAYFPADYRIGELPEGIYEPVQQEEQPRRPGDWSGTGWSPLKFYGVCEGGACEEDVL